MTRLKALNENCEMYDIRVANGLYAVDFMSFEITMDISLRKVTKENYEAVCDLDVSKEQEEYVACNMWSLVESMFNEGYQTRAIYFGEQPVGFFMWVTKTEDEISIWRFMVDKKYQQRGIGRKALDLALDEIKTSVGLKQIEICYNPKNAVAKEFYSSVGFCETGMENDEGDILAVVNLNT